MCLYVPIYSRSRCEHRLIRPFDFPVGDPLTLKHYPGLCRLEILTSLPSHIEHIVISSITSINIRTIAFLSDTHGFAPHNLANHPHRWRHLDNVMCGLVDELRRLGYEHTLELEFGFDSEKLEPGLDFGGFLPKFREKGLVKTLNTSSGDGSDLAVRFFPHDILCCGI